MHCLNQQFDESRKIFRNCGTCINCRINQREEWAVRLTHEWKYFDKACFVTLTYQDDKLPDNCSLRVLDLQNYFHYLRQDERMKNRKIKYFACGEYGDKGGLVQTGRYAGLYIHRPHYHAIIFGLDPFDDSDRAIISENWDKCEPYIFRKKLGLHGEWLDKQAIDYVTPDNINYTCGYIEKKLVGERKESEYTSRNLVPPFSLSSLGLGKRYCLEHKKQILDLCYVQRKGHILPIPRQYKKWLGVDNVPAFSEYQNARDERHANEKKPQSYELYNFDKITKKAIDMVNEQFPDVMRKIKDSRYCRDAEHMYYRVISKEIERQCELHLQSIHTRSL